MFQCCLVWIYKILLKKKNKKAWEVLEKLQQCDKGVTCDEFTTLFMAETSMPPEIKKRMNEHEESCSYHGSSEFHQSMLCSYPDMNGIEEHAAEIIEKYR